MKNYLAGQDVYIDVLFKQGVDTVIPDVGSVTYTLRDNGGTPIAGAVDVAVTTTSNTTRVPIVTTAAQNAKTGVFETRTLVVNYKISGGSRQQIFQYRLIDFVPLSVDADSARSLIGMSETEIPDEDLDFYTAYIEVCDDLTKATVDTALTAADSTNTAANKAVVCRALLDIMPGVQLRALQASKSNTAELTRFSKIDFAALSDWIQARYDDAAGVLDPTEASVVTFGAGVIMGATTPDIDYVTAATPVPPGQ